MKHRLILIVGADTPDGLLAGLRELAQDRKLESNGCIGVLRCGADFDYTVDTTQGDISVAHLLDTVRNGTWEKGL